MDAEFYRPNLIKLSKSISDNPNISIRRSGAVIDCSAFYPSIVHHYNFNQEGIPFLRVNEIQNGLLSIDEKTAFLHRRILELNRSTIAICEPGDLIIAKGGNSIGKVALLTNVYPKYSVCRDVLIVRTKSLSTINRFYLWMYLHSALGQSLLVRTASQTGQPHLTIESIARLKIPLIPVAEQDNIEDSYLAAKTAMEISRSAYTQAQQILESELGLDKLKHKKTSGYAARFSTVGLSDASNAGRFDAQCFSPNAVLFENWLRKNNQCESLNHLLEAKIKGRQQEETERRLIDYCSIKHISGHELTDASKCQPSPDTPLADQHNLLLAITGATIGKIGIVKRYKQLAFSGDLLCLKISSEIDPHYLLVVLDHKIGQIQLTRWITGSTNGHLAPRDIGRVLIPRLNSEIESRIAGLVEKSLNKKLESEKLLDQAKFRVEQLIEEAAAR